MLHSGKSLLGGQLTSKHKDVLEPSHAIDCPIYVMKGVWRLHTRSVLKKEYPSSQGLASSPTTDLTTL